MRPSTLLLSAAVTLSFASAAAADPAPGSWTAPSLAAAPITKIFAPNGFDNNDNVEVVLKGEFPNTCYKTGPAKAAVDKTAMTITLTPQAYVVGGTLFCSEMLVSFTQTVTIGTLDAGMYTVLIKDQPKVPVAKLAVGVARSASKDDYLYAPVDEVSLTRDAQGNDVIHLEGYYPELFTGCMITADIKTDDSTSDVVVIQPTAKIIPDGPNCTKVAVGQRFTLEKKLAQPMQAPEFLLHVRTLSGTALNRVVARPSSH